jgi:hypothetical protein
MRPVPSAGQYGMSTRRTHPLEWVSLGFAVVALSYSEWSLAVAAGAHPLVAAAVPGALDVYAVRAMRVRRHVPGVVLAMVSVNALSYLVHARVVPMTWPVLITVSAIAPLVFWAVHKLGHEEHVPAPVFEHAGSDDDVPVPYVVPEHNEGTFDEHVTSTPGVLDYVPEDWSTGVRHLPVLDEDPEHAPEHEELATVLPLPEGFTRAPARRLEDLMPQARSLYPGRVPTVREVKADMRVGTPKAQDIVNVLKRENGDDDGTD